MHGQAQIIPTTEAVHAVRTPVMEAGDLDYGFLESKGIAPLPAEEQVKGEPRLGEQGLHLKQSPYCFKPATAHAQVPQGESTC